MSEVPKVKTTIKRLLDATVLEFIFVAATVSSLTTRLKNAVVCQCSATRRCLWLLGVQMIRKGDDFLTKGIYFQLESFLALYFSTVCLLSW